MSNTMDKPMLIRLAVCLAILAGFVLVVLLPEMDAVNEIKRQIRSTRIAIEEQKLLRPRYLGFVDLAEKAARNKLPTPTPDALSRGTLQVFMKRLDNMASRNGLETRFILPQPRSVTAAKGTQEETLGLEGSFKGPYQAIRGFLVDVGSEGTIDRVEHMLMESDYDQIRLTLHLFVRLKQARNGGPT